MPACAQAHLPHTPAEFLSRCVNIQMHMVSCSSPQVIIHSRESTYGGNCLLLSSFYHSLNWPIVINWMRCTFLSSEICNFDFWVAQTCEKKWCNTDLVPVNDGFQINIKNKYTILNDIRKYISPLVMQLKEKQSFDNSKCFCALYSWELLLLDTMSVLL